MKYSVAAGTIELLLGDITEQNTDAIVNAANSRLSGGSGVDVAIHTQGGPKILEDTRQRYPMGCQTGEAVVSEPGNLPCRILIHAVGPVWHQGSAHESELLQRAYLRSLEVAVEYECDSIAFPAISCGAFALPVDQAASIALHTVKQWLESHNQPTTIRFVLYTEKIHQQFCAAAGRVLAGSESAQT